jgi:hypothetical protein
MRREYFARSVGAMNHDRKGVKTKLVTMTIGMSTAAFSDKDGTDRTVVTPIPKRTAATIELMTRDMDIRFVIGSSPPLHDAIKLGT